jgi:hypothetical protein
MMLIISFSPTFVMENEDMDTVDVYLFLLYTFDFYLYLIGTSTSVE